LKLTPNTSLHLATLKKKCNLLTKSDTAHASRQQPSYRQVIINFYTITISNFSRQKLQKMPRMALEKLNKQNIAEVSEKVQDSGATARDMAVKQNANCVVMNFHE
jgi:hypothetical protein